MRTKNLRLCVSESPLDDGFGHERGPGDENGFSVRPEERSLDPMPKSQ